jgi:hypothetical protein
VTGGSLVGSEQRGDRITFEYRSLQPVPFLNIAIAPYRQLVRGPVRLSFFAQDSAGAERVAEGIGRCLELFGRWFGSLPEAPHLTVIEIPEGWGSQASLSGGIIQEADAFRDGAAMQPVYHELAHLWDPPDLDRPSPRLNEGLASYLQRRAAATLDGWTGVDSVMNARAARLVERLQSDPVLGAIPLSHYGQEGLTDLSYSVGMLFYYALDRCVGSEEFNRLIGEFDRRYRGAGGTLAALRHDLESENRPGLRPLLQEWLFSTEWYQRLRAGETLQEMAASCARAER